MKETFNQLTIIVINKTKHHVKKLQDENEAK